jgi:hypothetical protein
VPVIPEILRESMTWLIALGAYLAAFALFLLWWARLPQ